MATPAPRPTEALFEALFELSLTGTVLYDPVYAAAGEVVDFTFARLNPAAQRLLHLPARPPATYLQQFPGAVASGAWGFHRDAWLTGEPRELRQNYQADGYDNYCVTVARRVGEQLLVSFTDTSDQERTTVEAALRASQAREQQARAEAEQQRNELQRFFAQTPVAMALFRGPNYVIELANEPMATIWGRPLAQVLGQPVFTALPDIRHQGFEAIFAAVLAQGTAYNLPEVPVTIDRGHPGQPTLGYFSLTYHPQRDAQGQPTGILTIAQEVTEQVRARQQVAHLNQELETRVQARTHERATAQAATEQQRRQFERLLLHTPVAICIFNGPEWVYEFVNPSYQAMFPGRELLGKRLVDALPEVADQPLMQILHRVYDTGEPFTAREILVPLARTADGPVENSYFDLTYQVRRDEAGQIDGFITYATDVTEQVLARQERDAQRQQLEQLFLHAPAPIVILDGPELVYQLVNPAYQQIFPSRALLGQPLLAALPELAASDIPAILQHVYRTGETFVAQELPLQLARAAGGPLEELHFTFTYQARRTSKDAVDGVLVFAHDVTEQVRARAATEEAATELRLLMAHAPAFLFRTNGAGHITYVNDALFEWSGLNRAALATLDEIWNLVHPEDQGALQASFEAAVGAGQPWASSPYRLRRRDGQYRWSYTRTQPYLGPGGAGAGYSGFSFEAHEQVELQRQLQRTNTDLDTFVYTASHDLRAPISNIEGLLLALEQELPAAGRVGDVPLMLKLMQEAVERFTRTIGHLTDVSRLHKEQQQPTQQVRLADVIEEVQLDLMPLLHQTRAHLTVDVPADLLLLFSAKNLRSVVYNLLSNALKYHHPDRVPEVLISCRPVDGYQVLTVQDNGLGLDLTQGQTQLFAMFQRLHTHVEGTGVGLYMVKKMVENAGGRIEVQSQLGQGSTFAVYLPQ